MKDRVEEELALLRQFFPDLEYREEGHWVRLPRFQVPPEGHWKSSEVDVAFQFLPGYPGRKPYAFHVNPPLELQNGGAISNATCPSNEPPWPGTWQKFSWDPTNWNPTTDVRTGSNMLSFVLTFADRLKQGA
jgi:hypothetical protein